MKGSGIWGRGTWQRTSLCKERIAFGMPSQASGGLGLYKIQHLLGSMIHLRILKNVERLANVLVG